MTTFLYSLTSGGNEQGNICVLKTGNPTELEITANSWTFHVIVGKHKYGNYICIPNWNVGSELSRLNDYFWNYERLCKYTSLKKQNANVIASALASLYFDDQAKEISL